MKNAEDRSKPFLRRISRIMLALSLCAACFVAALFFPNWAAERRAREFCGEISIGSDISAVTAKANDRKIFWGKNGGYTFYFPGMIFDKAVCEVSVGRDGKVISRISEMEND